MYQGPIKVVDSGSLYNSRITGGRLGVFQFGAFSTIWSNLKVTCLGHTNKAMYFDGNGTYLELSTVKELARLTYVQDLIMDKRYTIQSNSNSSVNFLVASFNYPLAHIY